MMVTYYLHVPAGPKVVSKIISLESIKELSDVIKRKPVIWDNIHANDYDQKRIFLGKLNMLYCVKF